MADQPKTRHGVRVVLLDGDDRLLMLRLHDPAVSRGLNPIPSDFWLLVGGSLERGETHEEAAHREVFEETGISDLTLGAWVWSREKLVTWPDGTPTRASERFYVGRVPSGTAVTFDHHTDQERTVVRGHRWWPDAQILAAEASDTFLPPGLGTLLGDVLRGDTPADPIQLAGTDRR